MKNKIFVATILAMIVSTGAYAKDQQITIDGQHILVTDVGEPGFFNSKIHSSDMNGGVYIIVPAGNSGVGTRLPNAEKAIAAEFEAHGIKVADSIENASVSITFTSMLALDMARADRAAAHTYAPNAGQVIATGGQLAGAVANSVHTAAGGAGGAVGFLIGAMWEDTKLGLLAMVAKKPSFFQNSSGNTYVKGDDISNNGLKVFYKLEKGKEASDDVILKMAIDQWIKEYVIQDEVTPAQAAPAPAATPAAPVAEVPAPAVTSVSAATLPQATDEKK